MIFVNPSDGAIRALLESVQTIAVIGLSPHPARPSHRVARAMQQRGYRIVPVRPHVSEVLGEKAYSTLGDIPFAIDLVNVFRAAEHIPAIVEQCLALHSTQPSAPPLQQVPSAIWIQEGIVHEAAAVRAQAGGMTVVMDRCIIKEYVRLY